MRWRKHKNRGLCLKARDAISVSFLFSYTVYRIKERKTFFFSKNTGQNVDPPHAFAALERNHPCDYFLGKVVVDRPMARGFHDYQRRALLDEHIVHRGKRGDEYQAPSQIPRGHFGRNGRPKGSSHDNSFFRVKVKGFLYEADAARRVCVIVPLFP